MSHLHQLQLDESTDVSNMSQLIVYDRYIKDGDIKDEFLFCKTLQTMTKADDVLRLVANFFQKQQIKMGEVKRSMYRWCPSHDRKEDWLYYC